MRSMGHDKQKRKRKEKKKKKKIIKKKEQKRKQRRIGDGLYFKMGLEKLLKSID